MTITLADLLKDSAYKLTQFKTAQMQALETSITIVEIAIEQDEETALCFIAREGGCYE